MMDQQDDLVEKGTESKRLLTSTGTLRSAYCGDAIGEVPRILPRKVKYPAVSNSAQWLAKIRA